MLRSKEAMGRGANMTDSFTRRNFLSVAAGAASIPFLLNAMELKAADLVGDPDFQFTFDDKAKRVRMGIIGVGGRGTALMIEVLKSKQAEFVAICDIDPEALKRATARCEGMSPKGYEKYQDLLADKNVE